MIFDWADVAAVGLAMRDIANEDDGGYTPSFRTASYTVEARYAHHVATASALREAYEAGGMAGYEDGRDGGYEEGYADGSEALREDSDIGDGPWETT